MITLETNIFVLRINTKTTIILINKVSIKKEKPRRKVITKTKSEGRSSRI